MQSENVAYGIKIARPSGLAVDIDGTLYVCEQGKNRILQFKNGKKSVFAGHSAPGYKNGSLLEAQFSRLQGLAIDRSSGALFVADAGNSAIRRIYDGNVTTIIGPPPGRSLNRVSSSDSSSSDSSNLELQRLQSCWSLAVDKFGDLFWDWKGQLKKLSHGQTQDVQVDASHQIFAQRRHLLRGICCADESDICPIYASYSCRAFDSDSDSDSGSSSESLLETRRQIPDPFSQGTPLELPTGMCRIGHVIYISDSTQNVIVSFDTVSRKRAVVCGVGEAAYIDGDFESAAFNYPTYIASDPTGNTLYVSDLRNNRVRIICLEDRKVRTLARLGGKSSKFPIVDAELSSGGAPTDIHDSSYQLVGVPVQHWTPKGIKLSRFISPDHTIRIMGRDYPVHKSWILSRCPALLTASSPLIEAPIEDNVVQGFLDFVYSSSDLKVHQDPKQILSQAFLCSVAGFDDQSTRCLKKLSKRANTVEFDAAALLELCNRFPGFAKGVEFFQKLAQRASYAKKKIPSVFDDDEDNPTAPLASVVQAPNSLANSSSSSVFRALEKLWQSREESGDFVISIGKRDGAQKIRCHSFVLHARWPYFALMIDSHMAEAQKRVLTLPEPSDPDAFPAEFVNLILQICYTGRADPTSILQLDDSSLLRLLECSGLYLSPDEPGSAFSYLLSYASATICRSVTLENCIEIFQNASQCPGLGDVEEFTRGLIVSEIPMRKKDRQFMSRIGKLPLELQVRLLWACI